MSVVTDPGHQEKVWLLLCNVQVRIYVAFRKASLVVRLKPVMNEGLAIPPSSHQINRSNSWGKGDLEWRVEERNNE